MVLAAVALLARHPRPTEAQIREGLAGNLCRCTGYTRIFAAVAAASRAEEAPAGGGEGPEAGSTAAEASGPPAVMAPGRSPR
jgi:xanthine dehydrogenase iron-sulfur cluster and FAD-binding subunit A